MLNFENDYMRGACPEVMQALVRTNMEQTLGYGDDPYTAAAVEKIREAYEAPKCEIIEMQNEGVLCQSGGNGGRYSERDYSNW